MPLQRTEHSASAVQTSNNIVQGSQTLTVQHPSKHELESSAEHTTERIDDKHLHQTRHSVNQLTHDDQRQMLEEASEVLLAEEVYRP